MLITRFLTFLFSFILLIFFFWCFQSYRGVPLGNWSSLASALPSSLGNTSLSSVLGTSLSSSKEVARINPEYMKVLENDRNTRIFPFRYFQDASLQLLPLVAVSGFFRDEAAKLKYDEYIKNGVCVFGITAYKSFPRKILDGTEGEYEIKSDFDYIGSIRNWLCCFSDPNEYGFTDKNNLIEMSESDFYDIDTTDVSNYGGSGDKIYDFIYVCLKDDDKTCPLDAWNAVNRNYRVARECFPIMIREFGLKGLVVGRVGCGLEAEYGDRIEVTDMLEYWDLQKRMRQSRFLFVPNIYDASPRVITECITKNVPVLMNRRILCGSKYVEYETGEFFNDQYDIRYALNSLLAKIDTISPQKWWKTHYGGQAESEKKLWKFIRDAFPGEFSHIDQIKFVV
jgi:hypothetical protein